VLFASFARYVDGLRLSGDFSYLDTLDDPFACRLLFGEFGCCGFPEGVEPGEGVCRVSCEDVVLALEDGDVGRVWGDLGVFERDVLRDLLCGGLGLDLSRVVDYWVGARGVSVEQFRRLLGVGVGLSDLVGCVLEGHLQPPVRVGGGYRPVEPVPLRGRPVFPGYVWLCGGDRFVIVFDGEIWSEGVNPDWGVCGLVDVPCVLSGVELGGEFFVDDVLCWDGLWLVGRDWRVRWRFLSGLGVWTVPGLWVSDRLELARVCRVLGGGFPRFRVCLGDMFWREGFLVELLARDGGLWTGDDVMVFECDLEYGVYRVDRGGRVWGMGSYPDLSVEVGELWGLDCVEGLGVAGFE